MEMEVKGMNGKQEQLKLDSQTDDRPLLKSDSIKLEDSIEELEKKYAPFVRRDVYGVMGRGQLPIMERILLTIALLTIAPLRLVLIFIVIVIYNLICRVCTAFSLSNRSEKEVERCLEDYSHMGGWRRVVIVTSGKLFSRLILFILGVYWINERYKDLNENSVRNDDQSTSDVPKRAGVIVSNHVSYLDILYHMSTSFPSFVAKRSVAKLPLIGLISKCLGCVFVQRESKTPDFKGVSDIVVQRVKESHENRSAPVMLLFPEGTTTNGEYLLPFKRGAFLAGVPVQPVILKYPYRRFSLAWESISGVRHLVLLLCQWVNRMEVVRLPVYIPSKEEIDDPKVYACNVREVMAGEGGLRKGEVGLAEKRVYHAAVNGNNSLRAPIVLHEKEE